MEFEGHHNEYLNWTENIMIKYWEIGLTLLTLLKKECLKGLTNWDETWLITWEFFLKNN